MGSPSTSTRAAIASDGQKVHDTVSRAKAASLSGWPCMNWA